MDRKELRYFLPFTAAVFLFIFSIPAADFPLNDDIIYFESVQNFFENGSLVNSQPYIVSLVLQILYGSLFASLFGLSYSTLMLSMMLMGGITVLATYFFLRTKLDVKYSILGSLLLLTNPVYFSLTHTFMTDVFALFFMVTSSMFLMKFTENKKYSHLVVGVALAVLGFWVRQYAIMAIAGLFLYLAFKDRKLLLSPKVLAIMFIPAIASIAIWGYWFYFLQDQSYVCPYTLGFGSTLVKNMIQLPIYLGYFFLPLGLIFLVGYKKVFSWIKRLGRWKLLPILMLIVMIAFIFVRDYVGVDLNPFDKSLAQPKGIGSLTISGDKALFFPDLLWAPIIALSFFSALSIVSLYIKKIKENLFLILAMFALALPMMFFVAFYDRYYLFLIPLSLPIILAELKNFKYAKVVLIAGIVILGAWSWYGTHDYLAWNTARWDGIDYLLASGVPPEKIDGGLEYDARFFDKCTDRSAAVIWHGWAYSISDEYIISFSHLEGYETLKTIDYRGPFGEKMGSIFVEDKIS